MMLSIKTCSVNVNPFSPPCIPPKFVLHGLSSKSKFLAVSQYTKPAASTHEGLSRFLFVIKSYSDCNISRQFTSASSHTNMKKGQIIGILSGLILAISMWLPRANNLVSCMDKEELAVFAWGIVIMGVLISLFAFMNKKGADIVSIIVAVIALLFSVVGISAFTEMGIDVGVGTGISMMLVASAGAIVGSIMNIMGRKGGMKEESKNHTLSTKLSNRGAGLFLAGVVFSLLLPDSGIGGPTLISSFFLGVIACCLGISAKNTRAIIVGAVPAILVIVFMIVGMVAEYNGVVVE